MRRNCVATRWVGTAMLRRNVFVYALIPTSLQPIAEVRIAVALRKCAPPRLRRGASRRRSRSGGDPSATAACHATRASRHSSGRATFGTRCFPFSRPVRSEREQPILCGAFGRRLTLDPHRGHGSRRRLAIRSFGFLAQCSRDIAVDTRDHALNVGRRRECRPVDVEVARARALLRDRVHAGDRSDRKARIAASARRRFANRPSWVSR